MRPCWTASTLSRDVPHVLHRSVYFPKTPDKLLSPPHATTPDTAGGPSHPPRRWLSWIPSAVPVCMRCVPLKLGDRLGALRGQGVTQASWLGQTIAKSTQEPWAAATAAQ